MAVLGVVSVMKNEEKIIDRFVSSLGPHIDYWLVIDTGSEDETMQVVQDGFAGIEGRILRRRWRSFGENYTEALQAARGNADWLLLLHADMTVDIHPDLKKWLATDPDPKVGAWQVLVKSGGIEYRVPLLTRGDLIWRYVGATHEYLEHAGRLQRPLLGLTITHHTDGSSRPEKFQRDRVLLEADLERNPKDPRTVFYLAQTYRDLGEKDLAIALYRQREGMGGWEEEAWYAGYQAAALSEDVDRLLELYRERPWRHETLKAAAEIVRRKEHADILFVETT